MKRITSNGWFRVFAGLAFMIFAEIGMAHKVDAPLTSDVFGFFLGMLLIVIGITTEDSRP